MSNIYEDLDHSTVPFAWLHSWLVVPITEGEEEVGGEAWRYDGLRNLQKSNC